MAIALRYSLLALPATSFGLGVWQLKRLEWKKQLIRDLEARLTAEPIDLLQIDSLADLTDMEYRRIKVRGKFDRNPDHSIYLSPRPLVMNKEAQRRGYSDLQTPIGMNVVTPFLLEETDLKILVNRGWLPQKDRRSSIGDGIQHGLGPEEGSLDLVGILRKSDRKSTFGMKNDERSNVWAIRDIEAMARALKTAPIYIEAGEELSPSLGPIGGQTQLKVRNEHLNYAITWFSLSALIGLMWYRVLIKGKRFKLR